MPTEWPPTKQIHPAITIPGRYKDWNGTVAIIKNIDPTSHFVWERTGNRSSFHLGYYNDCGWTYLGPIEPEKGWQVVQETKPVAAPVTFSLKRELHTSVPVCTVSPEGKIGAVVHKYISMYNLLYSPTDLIKAFGQALIDAATLAEERQKNV